MFCKDSYEEELNYLFCMFPQKKRQNESCRNRWGKAVLVERVKKKQLLGGKNDLSKLDLAFASNHFFPVLGCVVRCTLFA
jgi:hypothetical protein